MSADATLRLPDVDALIELINDGAFDDHLEDILAAAHGRKRERRGRRRPYGIVDFPEADEPYARSGPPLNPRVVREHVIPGRACG